LLKTAFADEAPRADHIRPNFNSHVCTLDGHSAQRRRSV